MARLVGVSRSQLISRLHELGYEWPQDGSDHQFMRKGTRTVKIPNEHRRKDVGVELLSRILKQAGIARKEWLGE